MEPIHDIVLIGGGASATLTAWHIAKRHQQRCTIIDPADRPGMGLAYSTPTLKHLLNVRAGKMSADDNDSGHFLRWLEENTCAGISPNAFTPRALYGLYLRDLFCSAAPIHVQARVIACRRRNGVFQLTLDCGSQILARQVVLACGHFSPRRLSGITIRAEESGRYHHHAWEEAIYARIPPHGPIILVGTGLTAIDVLLRLRANGHIGQVIALSRHGLLPMQHAPYSALVKPAVIPGVTPPTARAYLKQFHDIIKSGADWRAAVDSLRGYTNTLWYALPTIEKYRFRRHLQRRWDVARHRIAPQIAELVTAEIAAKTLRVVKGVIRQIEQSHDTLCVLCSNAASASDSILEADHVINCTGPSLDYSRVDSPLLHTLLHDGEVAPGFDGNGLLCSIQGEIIDRQGRIVPDLYTIGPARLGLDFESIAIQEIRQQARILADRLCAPTTVSPARRNDLS